MKLLNEQGWHLVKLIDLKKLDQLSLLIINFNCTWTLIVFCNFFNLRACCLSSTKFQDLILNFNCTTSKFSSIHLQIEHSCSIASRRNSLDNLDWKMQFFVFLNRSKLFLIFLLFKRFRTITIFRETRKKRVLCTLTRISCRSLPPRAICCAFCCPRCATAEAALSTFAYGPVLRYSINFDVGQRHVGQVQSGCNILFCYYPYWCECLCMYRISNAGLIYLNAVKLFLSLYDFNCIYMARFKILKGIPSFIFNRFWSLNKNLYLLDRHK